MKIKLLTVDSKKRQLIVTEYIWQSYFFHLSECKEVGMSFSTSNLRLWISTWKRLAYPLWVVERSCLSWRSSIILWSSTDGSEFPLQRWHRCITLSGEKRTNPKGEALDSPVDLHPFPKLWLRALGNDSKIKIADRNGQNKFLSQVGWAKAPSVTGWGVGHT